MHARRTRRTAVAAALVAAVVGADTAAAQSELPDLVVTRISNPPSVVGVGGEFRITDRVTNRGPGFARRSTTRYFIARSAAGRIDDEKGILLRGSRTVELLAPRASSGLPRDVEVPDVPAGTYDVVACADARRKVRERNEANNCRAAARTMRVRENVRPAVFIGGGAATGAFREGGDPAPLAPTLTVTDADDTRFTRATVRFVGGGAASGAIIGSVVGSDGLDWFSFTDQLGITGTYNSGTGVLTLTGTARVADYQKALRSVLYRHLGDDPRGSRTAEFRVRDAGAAWSRPERLTVTVDPVNDAPALAFAGPPDEKRAIGSSIALSDPDSEIAGATVRVVGWGGSQVDLRVESQLGITGTYNSGTGVLTLTGTTSAANYQTVLRSVTYTNVSASGPGGFEFQATDAQGGASNILPHVEQQP